MIPDEIDLKGENMSAKFIPKVSVQEYFIDFLGGLVPGILFLVGNIFILFPTIFIFESCFKKDPLKETFMTFLENILISTKDTPNAFWFVIFIIIFFFAYTIGHVFYRHDPKTPDKISVQRLEKKLRKKFKKEGEIKSKEEIDIEIKKELACLGSDDTCQFPYSNYDIYLEKRGLGYLMNFVLWKKERSKSWINLLKTRLMYYHPEKCGTIIRNEAHVRLASSTWYVSNFLTYASALGVSISLLSIILSTFFAKQFLSLSIGLEYHIIPLLIPFIVFLFSFYFYFAIPDFLHYQRLREVFYVLDTYYVSFEEDSNLMKLPLIESKDHVIYQYLTIRTGRKYKRSRYRRNNGNYSVI